MPLDDLFIRAKNLFVNSRLLKSGSWYLASTFVERAMAFVGVLIFTRLLTQFEYGTVAIYLSWFSIFTAIISLNTHASIQPARYDYDDKTYPNYVSAVSSLGMLASTVVFLVVLVLPAASIYDLIGLEKIYILLAIIAITFDIPFKALVFAWRIDYKYKNYVIITLISAFGKLILSIILIVLPFIFANDNATARIVGLVSVTVLTGLFALRWIFTQGHVIVDWQAWQHALRFGIPLIPHTLTGFILNHFDRILIDRLIGRAETGLYTLAYQISEIVYMIWYASNMTWIPWFYEQMKAENYDLIYKRSTQYLIAFTSIIGIVILIGPALLRLFTAEEYWEAARIIPIVMGGLFFTLPYSLYVNVQMYRKRTAFVSIGTGLAAGINVILNILWLPQYGYIAAAWSTLISYILLYLFHMTIVRFYFRSPIRFNDRLIFVFGSLIVLLAVTMNFAA